MPPGAQTQAPKPPTSRTSEVRQFKGMNQTDSRVGIDDDEAYWLENAILVGKGSIQIVPPRGDTVATIDQGVATLWGLTLDGAPILIAVCGDGSVQQVTPGGVVTEVAPAGSVTSDAHVTIWRGSPVLIVDPVEGYSSWDGTTYTVLDAAQVGSGIAVFEGRVWLFTARTIEFSAPNSFTDFSAGNGGGSTIITDEAFPGDIQGFISALEQLWTFAESAVDALANVQATGTAPSVTTTFSITNIASNVGTAAPASIIGYFRALAFLAPFGVYALSGVTPQKLSDKLDGLFPFLSFEPDVPAAVGVIESLPVLMFLVTYNGDLAEAGDGPLPMLLCFTQGKWFVGFQGDDLSWITSLVVDGVQQAWGTDGADIYQLFAGDEDAETTYKVISKLYAYGSSTTMKACTKMGFEFQAAAAVDPTLTVDSEFGSQDVTVTGGGVLIFTNALGEVLIFTNALAQVLIFLAAGLILSRSNANAFGRYLGWTLRGTDRRYRIQAFQQEFHPTREWSAP